MNAVPITKTGAFTRPLGPVRATPEEALAAQSRKHRGDMCLIFLADGRWQLWGKTANARGASHHPEDYEFLPTGRRARKRPVGNGTLYIEIQKMSDDEIREIHGAGVNAYWDCKGIGANPYDKQTDSIRHQTWQNGFLGNALNLLLEIRNVQ